MAHLIELEDLCDRNHLDVEINLEQLHRQLFPDSAPPQTNTDDLCDHMLQEVIEARFDFSPLLLTLTHGSLPHRRDGEHYLLQQYPDTDIWWDAWRSQRLTDLPLSQLSPS